MNSFWLTVGFGLGCRLWLEAVQVFWYGMKLCLRSVDLTTYVQCYCCSISLTSPSIHKASWAWRNRKPFTSVVTETTSSWSHGSSAEFIAESYWLTACPSQPPRRPWPGRLQSQPWPRAIVLQRTTIVELAKRDLPFPLASSRVYIWAGRSHCQDDLSRYLKIFKRSRLRY